MKMHVILKEVRPIIIIFHIAIPSKITKFKSGNTAHLHMLLPTLNAMLESAI
jgi:hypothetical protein